MGEKFIFNSYMPSYPLFVQLHEKKLKKGLEIHYHDVWEIYWLTEGKCKFFIDGSLFDMNAGDIAIAPPNSLHTTIYDSETPTSRFLVNFRSSDIPKNVENALRSVGFYLEAINGIHDEIEDIFLKMLKEYSSPDELSTELIKSHLSVLISLLFRGAKNRTASEAKHQCRFIETAINYIRENYAANITLDDVARKVSVSRIHLSRTFKSEIGIGLNEYINIYRLKQAQFLLAEFPTKPISEIAYDCGFNDSNYFASRFKKLLGVTPSQFRSHAAPSFIERQ